MKQYFYLLLTFVICALSACNNDMPESAENKSKAAENILTLRDTNRANYIGLGIRDINVQNIDGILHFATVDDFDRAIDILTAPDADLEAFETMLNFQSLKSYQDIILEILNDIDDPDVYLSAVESYKDYITYDAEMDYAKPIIDILGYASIGNREGWYAIEDILYQVTPDYLAIYSTQTRSAEPIKLQYKFDDLTKDEVEQRGENWQTFADGSYTYDGKRRAITTFKTIMYWTLESTIDGENTYSAKYSYQAFIRGQKKVLGKWKNYKTKLYFQKLSFIFEIPGYGYEWMQVTADDFVDSYQGKTHGGGAEYTSFTLTFVDSTRYIVHDFYRPYAILLQYRARTRGTETCGYPVNIGNSAYDMPSFKSCGNLP